MPRSKPKHPPIEDFALQNPQRDQACERLTRKLDKRTPHWILVPTLDGPRVEFYHRVPVRDLEAAWPGEKLAIVWMGITYISPLVPESYVRYVLVHLLHLNSRWCDSPQADVAKWTLGAKHHRAVEIELALAFSELGTQEFARYWRYRRRSCRTDFFKRTRRALALVRRRLERLAGLWKRTRVLQAISSWEEFVWPQELRLLRYRAIKAQLRCSTASVLLQH